MTDHRDPAEPPQLSSLLVGSIRIDFIEPDDAATALAIGHFRGAVNLLSAYPVALANESDDLATAINSSTVNLPDGMPLVWFARRSGLYVKDRVYGPDLMEHALDIGRQYGTKHFLYGTTPEVLSSLTATIERRWPGAEIVGTEAPPFRDITDDEIAETVATASALDADIVWVGMGVPKQVLIADQMAATGNASYVAIGAAFDFLSDNKSQAPSWMQRAGLEWLFRLITEPRRLWRRYLVYNVKFIRIILQTRRSGVNKPKGSTA